MKFTASMLAAIVLAFLVGALTPEDSWLIAVYDTLGTLFLNALKMIVIPLVVTAIIKSLIDIHVEEKLGFLGVKTALFYTLTTALACVVGLFAVRLFTPGVIGGTPAAEVLGLADSGAVLEKVQGQGFSSFAETLFSVIPSNLFVAATNGNLLGLIFFAILVGSVLRTMKSSDALTLKHVIGGGYELILRITTLIIYTAPLGVFGLIAEVAATTGIAALKPMLGFMLVVMGAMAIHAFGTLMAFVYMTGRSGIKHFFNMGPALLTAFSTASSAATLPVTLKCVQDNSKVSKRVSNLILPLGSTINMDGTALYECAAVLFIAQAYGMDLSIMQQFMVVALSLLTSFGVASVPAASLVAITLILGSFGLPAEAIGLIMVTDRLLDMLRTAVNIWGDSVGAVVLARLAGEDAVLKDS